MAEQKIQLTKEELKNAIECIANIQTSVKSAPILIALINKMSQMIDEVDK